MQNFSAKEGYQHYWCSSKSDCYHNFDYFDAAVTVLSKHHHLQMKLFSSLCDDVLDC
jgi:hypothetical protein